jgi:hypothetical protein
LRHILKEFMETPAYLLALRARYPLHPVFNHVKPTEAVLVEHPHVAETDETRLAYTRNPKDGEDFLINGHKRQTLTSVTKYLRRHYPDLKDHEIFSLSQQSDEFKFLTDIKEIIHAVETGPSSCMKSKSTACQHEWKMTGQYPVMLAWLRDPTNEEPDWDLHPYSVYDYPDWSLAIHKGPSPVDGSYQIVGRALVYKDTFVRSFYQNKDPAGYSQADTALESWLQEQGIEKQSAWDDGTPLRYIETDDGPLLPYIDGNNCHVEVCDDKLRVRESDSVGFYKADNVNGTGDEVEGEVACCSHCGDSIYENDDFSLVRGDCDSYICNSCIDEYTWVRASACDRIARWYVPDDEVVWVDGVAWDVHNLSDDIVHLESGDYTFEHNAVEIDGEWYLPEDSRVCEIEGEWYLKEDCWQDVDGNYHTTDEEFATVDNCRYPVDDDRIVKTEEGYFCLVDEAWEDVDGGYHTADTPYFEVDNKLFTAAQLEELHKDQLLLEFA